MLGLGFLLGERLGFCSNLALGVWMTVSFNPETPNDGTMMKSDRLGPRRY